MSDLLILIPAFNEAGRIGEVVRGVRAAVPDADVLVIDDASADTTGAEAARAGAVTVRLPVNGGYGTALQTGYKYAVRGGYAVVGQLDGDGQHLPEYLPAMLAELERPGIDVVVGSRFLDGDGHYSPSRARALGIGFFARVATLLTRRRVSDPTSGMQVMRVAVAEFFCGEVYPNDYPDADILILLHRSGFRVGEIAVRMLPPQPGKSMHAGHRSLYYIYKMLLSIFVTLLRPRRVES